MKRVLFFIFISNLLFGDINFDGHVNEDEWAQADKHLISYEVEPDTILLLNLKPKPLLLTMIIFYM